jgi:hypothetical protein
MHAKALRTHGWLNLYALIHFDNTEKRNLNLRKFQCDKAIPQIMRIDIQTI